MIPHTLSLVGYNFTDFKNINESDNEPRYIKQKAGGNIPVHAVSRQESPDDLWTWP
jgi:hypothetical protein